jgi:hypothetical protein
MRAKLVIATNVETFNTLLDAAIIELQSTGGVVDRITFRTEYDLYTKTRSYIALVTRNMKVTYAGATGELGVGISEPTRS